MYIFATFIYSEDESIYYHMEIYKPLKYIIAFLWFLGNNNCQCMDVV